MKKEITYSVDVPDGVEVKFAGRDVTVKGAAGTVTRTLLQPNITLKLDGNRIVINSNPATKREKMHMGSIEAHIKNMVTGVQTPFTYKLKVCASHFPMNVTVTGNELVIKNFLGEKVPRTIKFDMGVKVKINGDIVEIESPDLELAGRTASKFEGLTFVSKRDRRIFQDGLYIIHKAGVDF
jgi:large subunit ribosomal protein L6